MDAERLRKVEALYEAALGVEPARRAAFLKESCTGDESLRREVESLLLHDDQTGSFLQVPAVQMIADRARLAGGQRVTHYEILEKLGEGGMGVVYKAHDSRLKRFVALKALPPHRISDPERKQRFMQEARSASALNHPNIITVHDIGSAGGIDFIAMEYVEGKTLDELIGRNGLKLNETLKYAVQMADGLSAAHAAGIIHRDLKPGNVMVTAEGRVKVLDFGLAKLTERLPTSGEHSTEQPSTETGLILGTVSYMSPEQAEGKKLDARSDIFSFGSVLYEMLTGRAPFRRDTSALTLAALLHLEPPPLPAEIPHDVEKVVTRCLRKDPARRFQTIADIKVELEELKEELDFGKLRVVPPAAHGRRWPQLAVPVGLILLAAVGISAYRMMRTPGAPSASALSRLTSDSGLTTDPALSPDGKLLAYASDRSGEGELDIYVRQVSGGEPIRLTQGFGQNREPSFSPDGTSIAFASEREDGGIFVMSALGGPARKVAAQGRRPKFSPDGTQIAYWTGILGGGASFNYKNSCRVFVVAASGGTPRQIRSDFVAAAFPEWAPEGKHLLFLGNRDSKLPDEEDIDWWMTPLDEGRAISTGALRVTRQLGLTGPFTVYPWALVTPVWHPAGNLLVFPARSGDSRNLWRIGISPQTWKVIGTPERLTLSSAIEENPSVAPGSRGSVRLAFASLSETSDIWSLPLDPNAGKTKGQPKRLTSDAAADFHPALSRERTQMAYVSERSGGQEIWIRDLRTGREVSLNASRSGKFMPRFSPDSRMVSFASQKDGKFDIYLVPAAGGSAEMICGDCGQATSWSPDGRYLTGNSLDGRVTLIEVATRRRVDLLALPGRWFAGGHFSPDGRWLTFLDGRRSVEFIAPFRGGGLPPESEWIAVDAELRHWSPDGRLVVGQSGRDGFTCLWAQRLDPSTKRPVGPPVSIFHAHGRQSLRDDFDLSVGPEMAVFSMIERTGNLWMAEFR